MKNNYLITIAIFIILVLSIMLFYNYTLQKKEEGEFNNLVQSVKNLDESIKGEIKKISDKENIIKDEDVTDKLDKINDLAEKTKKENEEILANDILKNGTSSGSKYNGEACKDACW